MALQKGLIRRREAMDLCSRVGSGNGGCLRSPGED
jgi:hypothetical protein